MTRATTLSRRDPLARRGLGPFPLTSGSRPSEHQKPCAAPLRPDRAPWAVRSSPGGILDVLEYSYAIPKEMRQMRQGP